MFLKLKFSNKLLELFFFICVSFPIIILSFTILSCISNIILDNYNNKQVKIKWFNLSMYVFFYLITSIFTISIIHEILLRFKIWYEFDFNNSIKQIEDLNKYFPNDISNIIYHEYLDINCEYNSNIENMFKNVNSKTFKSYLNISVFIFIFIFFNIIF